MTAFFAGVACAIAVAAAYEDIDLFFRGKRISYTTRRNGRLGYIQPFYGKSELDALERDLNSLAGKGDLSALIRMAIDWTSIRAVEEWAAN